MISAGCAYPPSLRSISRQTRLGEVEITLDAPQRLVIDDVFISQANASQDQSVTGAMERWSFGVMRK